VRYLVLTLCVLMLLTAPVFAQEDIGIETQALTEELDAEASELLPSYEQVQSRSFWDVLQSMLFGSVSKANGEFKSALRLCATLLSIVTLFAVTSFSAEKYNTVAMIAGALAIAAAMLGSVQSMVHLARDTMDRMQSYSACFLPILASTTVMSGGIQSGSVLYGGTVLFSQLLMRLIGSLLIPMVYVYLAVATAESATDNKMLKEIREFIGWLISKSLRIIVYVYIGYISVTGVISGSADALTVKTTKAALSGMVPVVGGIVSDASESLLASAALLKSSVGTFGMLAVLAICIVPFLKVGVHYLLLKLTAAVSGAVGCTSHVTLLKRFSEAMGYLLGMCGAYALMLLISSVCFLRVVL